MNVNTVLQRSLEDYVVYLERLSRRSVPLLAKLASPDMHFADPLHDVYGAEAVMEIYAGMFEDQCNPGFRIADRAWGRDGNTGYLRWTRVHKTRVPIAGMSEVVFGADGKIIAQTDFWDSGRIVQRSYFSRWIGKWHRKI